MAYILKADGTRIDGVKGAGTTGEFTLKQLQEAVGGYIELVPRCRPLIAYCNEEGLLERLPVNVAASQQFKLLLVGDVIVLEDDDTDEPDDDDLE